MPRPQLSASLTLTLALLTGCEHGDAGDGATEPKDCAWADASRNVDASTPGAPRWGPLSPSRAKALLRDRAGIDSDTVDEVEGCALSVFMSGAFVVRFASGSKPRLPSWPGARASERAEARRDWLRRELPNLDDLEWMALVRASEHEADGNVEARAIYQCADAKHYVFVFEYSG